MGVLTCPIMIEGLKQSPTRNIPTLVVDGIKNKQKQIR
jgi:hypothetical protein